MSYTVNTLRIWKKQCSYRFKRSFFYREVLLLSA